MVGIECLFKNDPLCEQYVDYCPDCEEGEECVDCKHFLRCKGCIDGYLLLGTVRNEDDTLHHGECTEKNIDQCVLY